MTYSNSYPKPEKKEKEVMTASEFRRKYGGRKKGNRPGKSKGSKTERQKAIARADLWFSKYVRLFWADQNLLAQCCTCGKRHGIKTMDNGHYLSRRYLNTRWVFENAGPQCKFCNRYNQGNAPAMALWIEKHHGPNWLEKLNTMAHWRSSGKTTYDIRQIADKYRTLLNDLCRERGINNPWSKNA